MKRVKVTVRSRPISSGRRTLFLDYYPAVRVPESMKMIRQESLGMYVYDHPHNQIERRHNDTTLMQAEAIRCLRVQNIVNDEFGFLDRGRLNTDFLAYFRKILQGRNAGWKSLYKHFEHFAGGACRVSQVNVSLCLKFRDYLLTAKRFDRPDKTIHNNSASCYYRKFRGLLAIAYNDKLLDEDLNPQLQRIDRKPTRIEFLTQHELNDLSRTPCRIPVLKRASLFSCLTGLRFSDVHKLEWKDIIPNLEGTGFNFRVRTQKTEAEALMPLSEDALKLCGERGRGRIFQGLTKGMTDYPLRKWIEAAGITKHITFHCFRHTYAVLQLAGGTDIYTLSRMLTHKHVTTTEIYLDLLEQTKHQTLGRIQVHLD